MTGFEWVVQWTTAISLFVGAVTAVLALREYRLKVSAERRETDIRIIQLFTETVRMAQSRGQDHFSEKCVEQLFEKGIITKRDFEDMDGENRKRLFNKLQACVIPASTSKASQDAAIIAIAVLAKRYKEILEQPARAVLKAIQSNKDQEQQAGQALAILDET